METVVMVMMIVVCFNYIVKQTFRKAYFVAVSAIVCALFVGLAWPWAIEQSKNQIAGWLADSALMLDLAVVLTLEVALQITFCIVAAHIHSAGRVKPSVVRPGTARLSCALQPAGCRDLRPAGRIVPADGLVAGRRRGSRDSSGALGVEAPPARKGDPPRTAFSCQCTDCPFGNYRHGQRTHGRCRRHVGRLACSGRRNVLRRGGIAAWRGSFPNQTETYE